MGEVQATVILFVLLFLNLGYIVSIVNFRERFILELLLGCHKHVGLTPDQIRDLLWEPLRYLCRGR